MFLIDLCGFFRSRRGRALHLKLCILLARANANVRWLRRPGPWPGAEAATVTSLTVAQAWSNLNGSVTVTALRIAGVRIRACPSQPEESGLGLRRQARPVVEPECGVLTADSEAAAAMVQTRVGSESESAPRPAGRQLSLPQARA